jgi:hypothetical protein
MNFLSWCLDCDGPLRNREGKFALKYFCVRRRNKHKPKLWGAVRPDYASALSLMSRQV